MKFRGQAVSLRDLAATALPALLVVAAAFWLAYQFVKPAPPSTVVMSTGGPGGAYQAFGERYRALLARERITLDLLPSSGSVENLARLADPGSGVSVALIQGGTATEAEAPELETLGTVFVEPLWIFYRGAEAARLDAFSGKRLAVGADGSGTARLAGELLGASGIDRATTRLLPLGGADAADALLAGRVDAAFFVASIGAPAVQRLLRAERIRLMNLELAEAYARHYQFLALVTLPRGAVDFARVIPERDVTLLAARANLVVRKDLHPALAYLLMRAAVETHGEPGVFQRYGEFPAPANTDLPLSDEAKRFYKSGPPFLQRYLPFWLANLVDRLLVLLLPLVAVAFPLFRLLPVIYAWRVRSRIYRWYGELKFLEAEVDQAPSSAQLQEQLERLETIEDAVNRAKIPLSHSEHLYIFREHVAMVREKIRALGAAQKAAG
jgi:TRAP transporter TAXI family solute receptor